MPSCCMPNGVKVILGSDLVKNDLIKKVVAESGHQDCSPYLHKHTTVDQLDSGIAVLSTDMQANNQAYRLIHDFLKTTLLTLQ